MIAATPGTLTLAAELERPGSGFLEGQTFLARALLSLPIPRPALQCAGYGSNPSIHRRFSVLHEISKRSGAAKESHLESPCSSSMSLHLLLRLLELYGDIWRARLGHNQTQSEMEVLQDHVPGYH